LTNEFNRGFTQPYGAGPSVTALRGILDRPQFRALSAEYLRLQGNRPYGPDWFRLVGVNTRRGLAQAVGRESEYLSFYSEWSGFSHAADASPYITTGDQPGVTAFLGVRSPQHLPQRAFFAVVWLLRATQQMIDHFRAGESLNSWYMREVYRPFHELQNIRVTMR
jgi:hypothetical protein